MTPTPSQPVASDSCVTCPAEKSFVGCFVNMYPYNSFEKENAKPEEEETKKDTQKTPRGRTIAKPKRTTQKRKAQKENTKQRRTTVEN